MSVAGSGAVVDPELDEQVVALLHAFEHLHPAVLKDGRSAAVSVEHTFAGLVHLLSNAVHPGSNAAPANRSVDDGDPINEQRGELSSPARRTRRETVGHRGVSRDPHRGVWRLRGSPMLAAQKSNCTATGAAWRVLTTRAERIRRRASARPTWPSRCRSGARRHTCLAPRRTLSTDRPR